MKTFIKWLITSILLALIGLMIALNVEDWARFSGELNTNVILIGTILTFALVVVSVYCLFKANSEHQKNQIIISLFISLVPLSVFILNDVIFTVWFIGK